MIEDILVALQPDKRDFRRTTCLGLILEAMFTKRNKMESGDASQGDRKLGKNDVPVVFI